MPNCRPSLTMYSGVCLSTPYTHFKHFSCTLFIFSYSFHPHTSACYINILLITLSNIIILFLKLLFTHISYQCYSFIFGFLARSLKWLLCKRYYFWRYIQNIYISSLFNFVSYHFHSHSFFNPTFFPNTIIFIFLHSVCWNYSFFLDHPSHHYYTTTFFICT